MSALANFSSRNPLDDPKSLRLIRNTTCRDCNDLQFDEFIHICRSKRLDPILRQIYCWVLNKDQPAKAQMIAVVGIGGYRSIAVRTGLYMPSQKEPRIVRDASLIDKNNVYSMNPAGIVSATVWVKKQDAQGNWHTFSGKANWDEYAPFKRIYRVNPETGQDEYSGQQYLDKADKWFKSPETMISKVAEAAALRKGWPEDYANIWEEAEFDRTKTIDLTPSEWARQGDIDIKRRAVGGIGITMEWTAGDGMESIPVGQFSDRVVDFLDHHKDDPQAVVEMWERNRIGFKEFWVHRTGEALELRKKLVAARDQVLGRSSIQQTARAMTRRPQN